MKIDDGDQKMENAADTRHVPLSTVADFNFFHEKCAKVTNFDFTDCILKLSTKGIDW